MSIENPDIGHTEEPIEPLTPFQEDLVGLVGSKSPTPESYDILPTNEVMSIEVGDEAGFSIRSIARVLNPKQLLKGYGRFVKRTAKEYWQAEIAGTATALGAAWLANRYGPGLWGGWAMASAGTIGENVGFHGVNAIKEYRDLRHGLHRIKDAPPGAPKIQGVPYGRRKAITETGHYLGETFGPAELFDTPVRAISMWATSEAARKSPVAIDPSVAVFAGKILADHIYYGVAEPALKAYENRAERRLEAHTAAQQVERSA